VQDAVTLVVAMPALKLSSEIDDLKASLFDHCGPPTDLFLLGWRGTLLYRNNTDRLESRGAKRENESSTIITSAEFFWYSIDCVCMSSRSDSRSFNSWSMCVVFSRKISYKTVKAVSKPIWQPEKLPPAFTHATHSL
jgi:hypothetical protein